MTNATGNVVLVYAVVGALILLLVTAFSFRIVADAKRLRLGEYVDKPPQPHGPVAVFAGETAVAAEREDKAVQPMAV